MNDLSAPVDPQYPNSPVFDLDLQTKDIKPSPTSFSTSSSSSTSTTDRKPALSSLDILGPHIRSDPQADQAPPKSLTAQHIEHLQAKCISILNSRLWTHPDFATHVTSNFTAYMEYCPEPYVRSREEFISRHKQLCRDNPTYRFEIQDLNASVDEQKGAALCWFRLKILGCPEGVEREGTYVNMWKKSKGVWICYRQNGMRGMQVDGMT